MTLKSQHEIYLTTPFLTVNIGGGLFFCVRNCEKWVLHTRIEQDMEEEGLKTANHVPLLVLFLQAIMMMCAKRKQFHQIKGR